MRIVGYLVLLLLALYFIFVKPYFLAKSIYWDVRGLSFNFKDGLVLRDFILYLPTKDRVLYLRLMDASLKPWEGKAKEFNLIEVSTAPPSHKPFDYDFTSITKLANRLNLSVEKLYISNNYIPYGESLTLFIPKTEIKSGEVTSHDWTRVYWIHYEKVHTLQVFLQKAYAREDGKFLVEKAEVKSDLYNFELKGTWEGKRGNFTAFGKIEAINRENFYVGEISLELKGYIDYTTIRAGYKGVIKEVNIREKRQYEGVKIEGEYLWKWREENRLKGNLTSEGTVLSLDYSLKDDSLEGSFRGFILDNNLLGIEEKLYAILSGSLKINLRGKIIELQAYAPYLTFREEKLENVSLGLKVDYGEELKGNVNFSASQPFYLNFVGSFLKKDITGNLLLMDYPINKGEFSSKLSYTGSLSLRDGLLYLEGKGNLTHIVYKGLRLDSANYNLSLGEDYYKIALKGKGFSLIGDGSIKDKSFSGRLLLEGMNVDYLDFKANSLVGNVDLKVWGDHVRSFGILSGFVSREEISSWISLNFDLTKKGDDLFGNFDGRVEKAKLGIFSYKEGSFQGRLEKERLYLSFNFPEGLQGKGFYSLRDGLYNFEGSLNKSFNNLILKASYQVKGSENLLDASLIGEGMYKELSFPVRGKLSLKDKERVEGFLEAFSVKKDLFTLYVGGVKIFGDTKRGSVEVLPSSILIGNEIFSKVDFQRGKYEDKKIYLEGHISGLAEGSLRVNYTDSLEVYSEGIVDFDRLFYLARSRVLADGEGKILYKLSYTMEGLSFWAMGDKISLRSRYVALPLEGTLEINLKGNNLSGSFNFQGNKRAFLMGSIRGSSKQFRLDFDVSQMPILIRQQNLRASLILSGKGNINSDFINVNISGVFTNSGLLNLQKLEAKKTVLPEEYKRISLDLKITSSEPLRINIPEGFVYADINLKVEGTLYEPIYRLNAYLKGGNLNYFGKNFYVRKGEAVFTNKEQLIDLALITPTPDYSIIIDVKGNPQYPKTIVRSEPPRDVREVITTLVLGSREKEGLIPVAETVLSQLPQLGDIFKGANRLTGLDIKVQVSPAVSPTGEVGITTTISKDITERISVEHRQSTLKNPKETYTGGEVKLTPGTSIGGRLYSDKAQEYKMRVRRKFDF